MDRRLGATLAFLAFAVSIVIGLVVGNPVRVILGRSILALFAFYILGTLLAWVSDRILAERVDQMRAEHEQRIAALSAAAVDPTGDEATNVMADAVAGTRGSIGPAGESVGSG